MQAPPPAAAFSGVRPPGWGEVEAYLAKQDPVEAHASAWLQSLPPKLQKIIMARGPLIGEGGPTTELLKRINEETAKFHADAAAGGPSAPELSEIDRYLMEVPVEPHAACRLRELPWKQQQEVLSRGSLRTARDPTLLLMGLIAGVTSGAPDVPAQQPQVKEAEPEEEDEIDAIMKQIVDEDAQKKKKRKRGAKAETAQAAQKPENLDAINNKWAVLSDWRSSRPKETVVEASAADHEELEKAKDAAKAPSKDADLSTSIDDAFAALRKNIDDLEKKVG